jgi:hypothetical protein
MFFITEGEQLCKSTLDSDRNITDYIYAKESYIH